MEVFLLTKNLLTLLVAIPIHGLCALLCLRDARYFDLLLLWGRTRLPALLRATVGVWRASSYSPAGVDPPTAQWVARRHGGRVPGVTVRAVPNGSRP